MWTYLGSVNTSSEPVYVLSISVVALGLPPNICMIIAKVQKKMKY